jgi:predicted MPP superfamily phosphohydrolase
MINKIAYFGDLHLRLYKYHDEYKEVFFNEFIPKLKEIKPDLIIFGGDFYFFMVELSFVSIYSIYKIWKNI